MGSGLNWRILTMDREKKEGLNVKRDSLKGPMNLLKKMFINTYGKTKYYDYLYCINNQIIFNGVFVKQEVHY